MIEFSNHYWRVRHLIPLSSFLLFILPDWASKKQRSQRPPPPSLPPLSLSLSFPSLQTMVVVPPRPSPLAASGGRIYAPQGRICSWPPYLGGCRGGSGVLLLAAAATAGHGGVQPLLRITGQCARGPYVPGWRRPSSEFVPWWPSHPQRPVPRRPRPPAVGRSRRLPRAGRGPSG